MSDLLLLIAHLRKPLTPLAQPLLDEPLRTLGKLALSSLAALCVKENDLAGMLRVVQTDRRARRARRAHPVEAGSRLGLAPPPRQVTRFVPRLALRPEVVL